MLTAFCAALIREIPGLMERIRTYVTLIPTYARQVVLVCLGGFICCCIAFSLLLTCVSALKFSLMDGHISVNLLCSQLLELKFGVVVALRGTAVN